MFLLGCVLGEPPPDPGCPESVWYADGDGDGLGDATNWIASCEEREGFVAVAGDCDDAVAAIQAPSTWFYDADGDGFAGAKSTWDCNPGAGWHPASTDCDDVDPTVNPGALEVCDGRGIDEDCDSLVDAADPDATGSLAWYPDDDGDGWGADTPPVEACTAPTGHVARGGDCDDGRADVHPDAEEQCNGRDDDCDTRVDDDDGDVTGQSWWYADDDGDGWGDAADARYACAALHGEVADASDCDDGEPATNPNGVEVCAYGDEDCDGLSGDEDPSVSDPAPWRLDADGDGYGGDTLTACVPPADVVKDDGGLDCDDADPAVSPAADEACADGVDNDCDGTAAPCGLSGVALVSDAPLQFTGGNGRAGDGLGAALAFGDLTGDGVPDLAAGASWDDDAADQAGAAFVFAGPFSGTVSYLDATAHVLGQAERDQLGAALLIEDRDGDGQADLIVGAESRADVLVYLGPLGGEHGTPDEQVAGDGAGAGFGEGLAWADLTADGQGDLVVADEGSAVYVLSDAVTHLVVSLESSRGGHGLWAGDTDGDGVDDLVFNGGSGPEGTVYVVAGPVPSGTGAAADVATLALGGPYVNGAAGYGLSGGRDTNGDGYADLLVGSPWDAASNGATSLLLGPLRSSSSLATPDAELLGDATDGYAAGEEVALVPDLDGDGMDDVVVADIDATAGGLTDAGVVYVQFGPVAGSVDLARADGARHGTGDYDGVGGALLGPGDLDGDGWGDLWVGAAPFDSYAGRVYGFLGEGG